MKINHGNVVPEKNQYLRGQKMTTKKILLDNLKVLKSLISELQIDCNSELQSIQEKLSGKKPVTVKVKKSTEKKDDFNDADFCTLLVTTAFKKYIKSGKSKQYKLVGYSKNDENNIWHYAFNNNRKKIEEIPESDKNAIKRIVNENIEQYKTILDNVKKSYKVGA